jgi:hypothetical protein
VAIDTAAIIVILVALLLPPFLGAADHAANEGDSTPPFEVNLQGWAFAVLARGLSIATVRMKRGIDDL